MKIKTIKRLWTISLLAIDFAVIIIAGANMIGIELTDIATRILGIVILMALPILVFTTIKKQNM